MKYYKQVNEKGEIILFGTNCGGIEITETEYFELKKQYEAKKAAAEKYFNEIKTGVKTLAEIPKEYRNEVQILIDSEPVKSINAYGVDDDLYNQIIDDYTIELIEEGVIA